MAAQGHNDVSGHGLVLPGYMGRSRVAESLTRIKEWLFGVMMADSRLSEWHRALTEHRLSQAKRLSRPVDDDDPAPLVRLSRDEWARLTIRFWLFDGATSEGYGPATTSFTNTQESELTVLPYESDNIVKDVEDSEMDTGTSEYHTIIMQPHIDRHHLIMLRDDRLEAERWAGMPPTEVGSSLVERAIKAVQEYQEEPSRQASPDVWEGDQASPQ